MANGSFFFQDNNGLIRQAIRTQSNSDWSTSSHLNASTNLYLNYSSNPKNNTPLAVTILSGDEDEGSEEVTSIKARR